MRSVHKVHPEFGCSYQSSNFHQKAGLAVAFIISGSIAGASGLMLQMTGHEPNVDGRSVIAAIPLSPSTTLSTIVSAASPAMSAPESQQNSTSPSNSPQTAPLNAIATTVIAPTREAMTPTVTASTREATTEIPQQPLAPSKKSQKAVRSPNQRNHGWNNASGWGRYAHERPSSSW
jgi:hypothetical protein